MKLPKDAVFAVNTTLKYVEAFASKTEAISRCPGLEIAEGDWLFFAADGTPLETQFSAQAYVDTERGFYGNGIYTLRAVEGENLQSMLFNLCVKNDGIRFGPFAEPEN